MSLFEIFIFWNIYGLTNCNSVACHFVNFFTPYTLYEHTQKQKYFFTEKKFLFLQTALNNLTIKELSPKYFRNILFLNISFFLSV